MTYCVGIDLGTTNSTLAYQKVGEEVLRQLSIKQRVDQGMEGEQFNLPSFVLFPPGEELCVGQFAKVRGEELPDRVVSSAKSWLSHSGVDRRSAFLPLEHDEKVSPVEAISLFLSHLKSEWERQMPPLKEQTVLITVPASFDPDARAFVQEAAKMAGYPSIILLEEPLAAFYAWLWKQRENWRNLIHVGETVLVVDIGGGTTDFTLIKVEEEEGNLILRREAVGEHLLLGGDNLDLALAYFVQQKAGKELPMNALVHSCRTAKEELLSGMKETSVTVLGQGSALIGNTTKTPLTQEEVQKLLVDGFFPHVPLETAVQSERKAALSALGLPFVRDPRITAQLASFLQKHTLPSAVLFNGGTLKARPFQERLHQVLSDWKGEEVRLLPDPDFDFAVSLGATYYGAGEGIRVKAPSCRSFWIGVEGAMPAIPGVKPPLQMHCIAPKGLEEGSETTLDEEFSLVLGEPALFRFFAGEEEAQELPPIEAEMAGEGLAIVKLKAKLTELGMLELWCEADDGRHWNLEFNARPEAIVASAAF
ncbi:MAG: Hsp70 family protein [Chlamydiales bacterium]|nr:Hsp70 family protein [Chlamydiales bacterium]